MQDFHLLLPPFSFHVQTDIPLVVDNARLIYGDCFREKIEEDIFIDYYLSVKSGGGIRKLFKAQSRFFCDEREPFKPLNHNQAYAMLEWGMNWAVAAHELQHVIIHSAVLEKDGKAILFPAPPGSGKSTITAHLANSGWRLLSDEMALITPFSKQVIPFVRPICLKNDSIDLAKNWFPEAKFSSIARDTHKGDVIHMAPNASSFKAATTPAQIVGIVFPQYTRGSDLEVYQLNMREAFMELTQNAFNFTAIGKDSFQTITQLIEKVLVFETRYSELEELESFLLEELIHLEQ